jgi:hypothetical protein
MSITVPSAVNRRFRMPGVKGMEATQEPRPCSIAIVNKAAVFLCVGLWVDYVTNPDHNRWLCMTVVLGTCIPGTTIPGTTIPGTTTPFSPARYALTDGIHAMFDTIIYQVVARVEDQILFCMYYVIQRYNFRSWAPVLKELKVNKSWMGWNRQPHQIMQHPASPLVTMVTIE